MRRAQPGRTEMASWAGAGSTPTSLVRVLFRPEVSPDTAQGAGTGIARPAFAPRGAGLRMPRPCRRGSHATLPARRRDVGEHPRIPRHGRSGRLPVGHVRRRRRLPDDAAADLRRHPGRGRRRHRGGADPRLLGVGRARAMAAAQHRRQDGRRAAGGRPRRLGGRRAAGRRAAPAGRVRCLRRRLLRHLPRRHRHADADREHQHHPQGPRRPGRVRAAARPAQLDARPAAEDALQPLQALHQRHSAAAARRSSSACWRPSWASAAASSWCRP